MDGKPITATEAEPVAAEAERDEFDLDFRPVCYFAPTPAAQGLLARIRGTRRRDVALRLLAAGEDPASLEWLTDDSLPPDVGEALMAVHPALSGGEYLPSTEEAEVEIARLELVGTTLGDVVSVRARPDGEQIAYRIVDEYGSKIVPGIERSTVPLTMGELIDLIEDSDTGPGLSDLRLRVIQGEEPRNLRHFMRVRSTFYPELEAWYEREIESFVDAAKNENADEDER